MTGEGQLFPRFLKRRGMDCNGKYSDKHDNIYDKNSRMALSKETAYDDFS